MSHSISLLFHQLLWNHSIFRVFSVHTAAAATLAVLAARSAEGHGARNLPDADAGGSCWGSPITNAAGGL